LLHKQFDYISRLEGGEIFQIILGHWQEQNLIAFNWEGGDVPNQFKRLAGSYYTPVIYELGGVIEQVHK
jgi:hypothetical protein